MYIGCKKMLLKPDLSILKETALVDHEYRTETVHI
jgi:hypothetical protein